MPGQKQESPCGHVLVRGEVLFMGIVNVTPDSFSDGGDYTTCKRAVAQAQKLAREGADIVDIGGESTRPGAEYVPVEEELARVIPVIEALVAVKKSSRDFRARISIDSRKAEVMRAALDAGADILNDVTALQFDEDSLTVAASCDCPVILMHGLMHDGRGDPARMQDNPQYEDVVSEVYEYLGARISVCEAAGIERARLVIDPGIGFGKTLSHNLSLLAALDRFNDLGVPVLLGASRKRFIGALSGEDDPGEREPGSIAAALQGISQGAQILRVHDVKKTRQAVAVWQAIEMAKG